MRYHAVKVEAFWLACVVVVWWGTCADARQSACYAGHVSALSASNADFEIHDGFGKGSSPPPHDPLCYARMGKSLSNGAPIGSKDAVDDFIVDAPGPVALTDGIDCPWEKHTPPGFVSVFSYQSCVPSKIANPSVTLIFKRHSESAFDHPDLSVSPYHVGWSVDAIHTDTKVSYRDVLSGDISWYGEDEPTGRVQILDATDPWWPQQCPSPGPPFCTPPTPLMIYDDQVSSPTVLTLRGSSVASLGDVISGSGASGPEFLVCSPGWSTSTEKGRVEVMSFNNGSESQQFEWFGTPSVPIHGPVGVLGDLTGDGANDFGYMLRDASSGVTTVQLRNVATGASHLSINDGESWATTAGVTIQCDNTSATLLYDYAGRKLAGVPDLDGDSVPDFVVAQRTASYPSVAAVISGAVSPPGGNRLIRELVLPSGLATSIISSIAVGVHTAGPTCQRIDVVIGMPDADSARGKIYVFNARTGCLRRDIGGVEEGEALGTAVGTGDFDGDGDADIVAGAPLFDAAPPLFDPDNDDYHGRVFLFEHRQADINNDGCLTASDFSAFQSAWTNGSLNADYNCSGALDIGDFGAYQTSWVNECPDEQCGRCASASCG